jgi:hypothetical protein
MKPGQQYSKILLLLCFALIASSKPVKLATADTEITLEAGPEAPRLLGIAMPDGAIWNNRAPEKLIPAPWRFLPSQSTASSRLVRFVYVSASPHLRLFWEWEARSPHGPIEHRIRIQNLSGQELSLPLQDSFQFNFAVSPQEQLKQFWVEKGASSPSPQGGVHLVALQDGYQWTGTSSTYAHPQNGAPREIIPYLLVERAASNQEGWYVGIEFSGRTRISLRKGTSSISGEAGLNPSPGPYKTSLPAGATYETPTVFLGTFRGGPDVAGNILRRWIREVLNNPATLRNPQYPLLVSNSWGSGMAINEQQAQGMIQDASTLGLEMFHLDAGWFRTIGDWTANPEKFPHGIDAVADYAHKLGLKFGLWTDWTQAGTEAVHALPTRNWLTIDPPKGWKPADFKGITMDIGVPAARQWASALLTKLVHDFHLDMLEHDGYLVAQGCERKDHPHAPLDEVTAKRFRDEDFLWVSGSNDTDVSDRATRGYYHVQSQLRNQFPALLLEICNDGGRMVDFGSAAHGDYFSISDAYDPLGNRRAFFDASYVLPPAMLEAYVEKWPSPSIAGFRYMLRSGLMGWFSLMQDSNTWIAPQHAAAREEFALYKNRLRPLIRSADLYHASQRPDGLHWDGIQYFDPATGQGVLYAFHGSLEADSTHTFPIRGLQAQRQYQITFQDHSAPDYQASGEEITTRGILVKEPTPNSSELILISQIGAKS